MWRASSIAPHKAARNSNRAAKKQIYAARFTAKIASNRACQGGKVFNLVRGLQREIDEDPAAAAVLQPLKERAERVLKELEERRVTGLAAIDHLADLAAEKEIAMKAAHDGGLSAPAFAVFWTLRDLESLKAAAIDKMKLAKDAEEILKRFPNAAVNVDEQRRLRATLYRPLLASAPDERARIVDLIVKLLLADADA